MYLNSFEEVLQSEVPVLVDFWAPWCGPCRHLLPTIEKLSQEYPVFKVNTEEESELASQYGVKALPTLLIFKGGAVVAKGVGLKREQDLRAAMEQAAAK